MSDGLRNIGWGPFRMPGERKRMERAQRHAEETMRAIKRFRRQDQKVADVVNAAAHDARIDELRRLIGESVGLDSRTGEMGVFVRTIEERIAELEGGQQ